MRKMPAALAVSLFLFASTAQSQLPERKQPQTGTPSQPSQLSGILFTASPEAASEDADGVHVEASLAPVAVVSQGKLSGCQLDKHGQPTKAFQARLDLFYSSRKELPLYSGGDRVGTARILNSCADSELAGLERCAKYTEAKQGNEHLKELSGTIWSGSTPIAPHAALSFEASPQEKELFLAAGTKTLAAKGIHVERLRVSSKKVSKIEVAPGMTLLIGNVAYWAPQPKTRSYLSDRMLFAISLEKPESPPLIEDLYSVVIRLQNGAPEPESEEQLDDGEKYDSEELVDNFPLFPGEPDVIISKDNMNEMWAYSIYRWSGKAYQRIITSCGDGI